METQSINGVAFKQSGGSSLTGGGSLEETFDTFLLLLTTQLQNQDPLDPLDTNQFTEQLVNFTSVEQQIKGNQLLEQMLAGQKNAGLTTAISLIGSSIEYNGNVVALSESTAGMKYILPANASEATIEIYDTSGDLVRTVSVDPSAGQHDFVWDGRTDDGTLMEDGLYAFQLVAKDSEGTVVDSAVNPIATITGVETVGDEILLRSGNDLLIPLSDLRSVHGQPQAQPQA